MDQSTQSVDEYTLAAFLAGTLTETRRKEVIACLARDQDARELLRMSYQALEASSEPKLVLVPRGTSDETPSVTAPVKVPPSVTPMASLRRIMHYAAAAVVVFAIGLGVRLSIHPPTSDQYRGEQAMTSLELRENGKEGQLSFSWNEVKDAASYRVVIWNPLEATIVSEGTVTENQLKADSPLLSEIEARLLPGQVYQLRIDAVDARNRLLQSSDPLDFQLSP